MGHLLVAEGRSGWLGSLEADLLADEDDVDAAGQTSASADVLIYNTRQCAPTRRRRVG